MSNRQNNSQTTSTLRRASRAWLLHAPALILGSAGLITLTSPAEASNPSLNVTYFTVSETGDPDYNYGCCTPVYTNEVTSTLGPGGYPVYNASYGGHNLANSTDVDANGQLTWWNPAENPNVKQTGSGTVTLPYANYAFYPPNGTGSNDANGFQAAIFRGTLTVPVAESVQFSFGADDDAFLALGDTVISQEGGIHGVSPAPVVTQVLQPGVSYPLTLFYTDRNQTGAGLYFSLTTSNVTLSGVPEPQSWSLMILGVGAVGGALRRRLRPTAA